MATVNIGIKGYDGLPFVDEEARNMLSQLGITNEFNGKKCHEIIFLYNCDSEQIP